MPEGSPILVVDDDRRMRELLAELFSEQGSQVTIAADGNEAIQAIKHSHFNLIITDLQMPHQDGIAILRQAKIVDAEVPVIMITGHGSIDSALSAMKQGAYDYIEKPFDPEELLLLANRAVDHYQLSCRTKQLNETLEKLRAQEIVGTSAAIGKVKELIARIAPLDVAVLIQGETGTGKELIARLIHSYSRRSEKPFLPINCGAITETLLESELFGHEAGSFTGANHTKKGLVELANNGSLFLDEINNMPASFQAKMLRFLQDQSFMRVGASKQLFADVRIIAATNVNLAEEVAANRFREDLLFRLKVMVVNLPPLREREGDIPELAYYFLQKYNRLYEKKIGKIQRHVLDIFAEYAWPGNVRELENIISSSVIMATGSAITTACLPEEFREETLSFPIKQSLNISYMEQQLITNALQKARGNKAKAARLLGIDTSTLWRKLKRYGIQ